MKIFYFSGTGNSLFAAKQISEAIPNSKVVSITENDYSSDSETVIVTPLYHYSLPPIVIDFIDNLNLDSCNFLSLIITAEYPNGNAIELGKKLLLKKNKELNSAYYVKMPTNYLISSKMLTDKSIKKTLKISSKKISKIIVDLIQNSSYFDKESKLYAKLLNTRKSYSDFNSKYSSYDNSFKVNSSCNLCKICEKSCPAQNINIEKKPEWQGDCKACLRCINICPKNAINYTTATENKRRYINPEIKISDL